MHLALFLRIEGARAFHDEVDAEVGPGQFARVARAEDAHAVAVDDHVVAVRFNRGVETAVAGVVAQEVRVDVHVTRRVDGHDFDVVGLAGFVVGAENVAADAAETVDGNTDGHFVAIPVFWSVT